MAVDCLLPFPVEFRLVDDRSREHVLRDDLVGAADELTGGIVGIADQRTHASGLLATDRHTPGLAPPLLWNDNRMSATSSGSLPAVPYRQVRAAHTEDTITVYQAYSSAIADPALAAGTFVPPFRTERMTWIKPSFLWMAYRCGWATKDGQERVLAVRITREGFHWALAHSCLSHYEPTIHASREQWSQRLHEQPVRIQWDPERGLRHEPLDHRAIQIGLRGEAVERYIGQWIVSIAEVTPAMHRIGELVASGLTDDATALLPDEPPYPLEEDVAALVGATPVSPQR